MAKGRRASNNPEIIACFKCDVRLNQLNEINHLKSQVSILSMRNRKMEYAIRWVLGDMGDFPHYPEDSPSYPWRDELRKRSGIPSTT